ncbi:hypothetical protein Hypma_000108 [Hypsizygus marmoreus]|uniref:Uncharacterized protein n=1 Tax=Hypsizygus marmoreus TaxID=39966 RepID=A0A369KC36_HYPMA|nr:hypothetical protein Hypma_000108 [Hypsizygus marmoreus]
MSASDSEPQPRTFVQRCHLNILPDDVLSDTKYAVYAVYFDDFGVVCGSIDIVTQAYTELRAQRQVPTMLRVEGITEATYLLGTDDESYLSLGPIFAFHRPVPKIVSDERDARNDYHVYSAYYPHIPVLITTDVKLASEFIHRGVYGDWTHVPLS